jgi:hypothetical protein
MCVDKRWGRVELGELVEGGLLSMLGAGELSKKSLFYICIQINPSWR